LEFSPAAAFENQAAANQKQLSPVSSANPTVSQKEYNDRLFKHRNNYIPLQQHLTTSFFASLQNSFPFFCNSQQHVFTSLPVSVHVIFGDAARPTPAITAITAKGSHLVIVFMNFTSSAYFPFHRQDSRPRSNTSFENFCVIF
jgi:hypothetical protein